MPIPGLRRADLHGLSLVGWDRGAGLHRRALGAHRQTGGDCAPPVPVLLSVGERCPFRARASTTTSQFASCVAASKPKSSRSLRRGSFRQLPPVHGAVKACAFAISAVLSRVSIEPCLTS